MLVSKGLVTNYGEGGRASKLEGGGTREVLPLQKGGWRGGGGVQNKF